MSKEFFDALKEYTKEHPNFWIRNRDRCAGCDRLLDRNEKWYSPRYSRYAHGELCGACHSRDSTKDFIGIRRNKIANDRINPYEEKQAA